MERHPKWWSREETDENTNSKFEIMHLYLDTNGNQHHTKVQHQNCIHYHFILNTAKVQVRYYVQIAPEIYPDQLSKY